MTIDTKAIRDEYPFDPNLKGYRTWDREDKLGPPPWDDTPELRKWEEVHQHDVRQKCYPEYGCALVEYEEAALIHLLCDEIDRLRAEGSPGVMHETDRSFYDLAIKERDYYKRQGGEGQRPCGYSDLYETECTHCRGDELLPPARLRQGREDMDLDEWDLGGAE